MLQHAAPGRIGVPAVVVAGVDRQQRLAEPQSEPAQRLHAALQCPERPAPTGDALGLQVAAQAQKKVMLHLPLHLLQPLLTQGHQQLPQGHFQLGRRQQRRQTAADHLRTPPLLRPGAVTDLPQVQRRLPAQRARQLAQVARAHAQRRRIGALFRAQCPDHAIQRAPPVQPAQFQRLVQRLLQRTAPQQHRALALQPTLLGQPRRNGLDLLGLADHQQQADFVAPEKAVSQGQ
ncbi:hypothetical protein D9M70_503370 [compost metagenome]